MYSLAFLSFFAFFLTLALTPLVRRLGLRFHLVDRPGDPRKSHREATPRLGGVAILVSYSLAIGLWLLLPFSAVALVGEKLNGSFEISLNLMGAAVIVFFTGLVDDLYGIAPWQKIACQVLAAVSAWAGGVRILNFGAWAYDADAAWWSLPLTVLWLVGASNAFNLIDGVDGVATGAGLFATCTMLAAALLHRDFSLAVAIVPLVGALAAFLRYNFAPASIFLGDCGSLTIGFLLGCYGVIWSHKSATALGMTAPLIALAIPLIEVFVSIVRRWFASRPIFAADRNHMHHRLLEQGMTPRGVALVVYAACGIAAALSLMQASLNRQHAGLILLAVCAITLAAVRRLGYREFEVAGRMVMRGTLRKVMRHEMYMDGLRLALIESQTAEECWAHLSEAAREFGMNEIAAKIGQKQWQARLGAMNPEECWQVRIPLSPTDWVNFSRAFRDPREINVTGALADLIFFTLNAQKLRQLAAVKVVPALAVAEV